MSLLPCQLHPEQAAALTNTVPGCYPARPIMSGRMAIDTLILPITDDVPDRAVYYPATGILCYPVLRAGGRRESVEHECPLGRPGDQLWIREQLEIEQVLAPREGRAVRVLDRTTRRRQIVYLDESDPDYCAGQVIQTPRIEWASPERLLVREVQVMRLRDLTDDWAKRLGAGAALERMHGLQRRSHLAGLRLWWRSWYGTTDWLRNTRRACWLVGFERTFKEEVA